MKEKQERKQRGLVTLFVCKGGDFMENVTEEKKKALIVFISQANDNDIEKIINYMEEEGICIEMPELPSNDYTDVQPYITDEYLNECNSGNLNKIVEELLKKIQHKIDLSYILLMMARMLAYLINKRTKVIGALVKIPKHYYKEVDYPKRYSVYVL